MGRNFVCVLFLLMAFITRGTETRWNFISPTQFSSGSGKTHFECGLTPGLQVSLFFSTAASGRQVDLSDPTCNLATSITWLMLADGDVVDSSVFGEGKTSFFSTEYSTGTCFLSVEKSQPFFLAFEAYEIVFKFDPETGEALLERGDPFYGWIKLDAGTGDSMCLVGSAVAMSGCGIVVGGAAIPEPTSLMLLLIGVSSLVLCRQQHEAERNFDIIAASRENRNKRGIL